MPLFGQLQKGSGENLACLPTAKAETRLVGPHVKQLVQGFEGKTLTRKMVDRAAILPGKSQATVMICSANLNWVLDLK